MASNYNLIEEHLEAMHPGNGEPAPQDCCSAGVDQLLTELGPEICAPADTHSNWQHPNPAVIAAVAQLAVPVHVAAAPRSQLCEWVDIFVR